MVLFSEIGCNFVDRFSRSAEVPCLCMACTILQHPLWRIIMSVHVHGILHHLITLAIPAG